MITESVLKSWFSDNGSRPFPLDESVVGKDTVPYPVLVGLEVGIPSTMLTGNTIAEGYALHISSLLITPDRISLEVSAGDKGVVASVTTTMTDLFDADGGVAGFALSPTEVTDDNTIGVSGTVYFGPAGVIQSLVGSYTYTAEQGLIDVSCIHAYPDILRGISVNGRLLTGNVTFVEGDNVTLEFNDDGELVISCTPDAPLGITNREDLLDAVVGRYGTPVLSINGVAPDQNGNIQIVPDAGDDDKSCVDVKAIDHGIALANTCAEPCCDKDTYIALITEAIGELNTRAARLSSYLESVTSTLNSLQNELGILRLGIKQQ